MPRGTATRVPIADHHAPPRRRTTIHARSSAAPGARGSTQIAISGEPRSISRSRRSARDHRLSTCPGFVRPADIVRNSAGHRTARCNRPYEPCIAGPISLQRRRTRRPCTQRRGPQAPEQAPLQRRSARSRPRPSWTRSPGWGRCLHIVENPPPFGGEAEAGDPLLENARSTSAGQTSSIPRMSRTCFSDLLLTIR